MTEPTSHPVALVTGAARGIGAATVTMLVEQGWCVVAADRCTNYLELDYPMGTRGELDDVVALANTLRPNSAVAAVADVREQASLDAAAQLAVDAFGRLDAAVAAAGIMIGAECGWELSAELFALNLDVNLTGVQRTAVAALPRIIKTAGHGQGRFVAVASAAGLSGRPAIGAYTAAKHGVIGLVRSLAAELAPLGVTANCVAPGSTDTTILAASAAVYDLDSVEDFVVHQPIGRLLRAEEVAAGVTWLCAPQRSGVTGIVLPIDGGMTL